VVARRSVGLPAPEILALALGEPFDLIVLGAHGRHGLAHLVLGSVSEQVMRHAPCPVLTLGSEVARALRG